MPLPNLISVAAPEPRLPCPLQALPQELVDEVLSYLDRTALCRFRSSAHWANDCVRALKHPSMGLTRSTARRPAVRQSVGEFIDHQSAAREAMFTGHIGCEHIVDVDLHQSNSYAMPGEPRAFVTMPSQGLVHIDASASPAICVVAPAHSSGAQHLRPRAQIVEARDIAGDKGASVITVLQSNSELGVWVWHRPAPARYTTLHPRHGLHAIDLGHARQVTRLSADGRGLLTHLPSREASCFWRLSGDTFAAAMPQEYAKSRRLEAHSPADGVIFRVESQGFRLLRPSTGESWRSTQAWPRVLSTDGFSPSGKSLWLTILPKVDDGDDEATAMRSTGLFKVITQVDGSAHLAPIDTAPTASSHMVMTYDWHITPVNDWGRTVGIWGSSLIASRLQVRHDYTLTENQQPGARNYLPGPAPQIKMRREGILSAGEDEHGAQMLWHGPRLQDEDNYWVAGHLGRLSPTGKLVFTPAHQTMAQLLFAHQAHLPAWTSEPWRLHWRPDLSRALLLRQDRTTSRDLWPNGPPVPLTMQILRFEPGAPAKSYQTHLGRWFAAQTERADAADTASA